MKINPKINPAKGELTIGTMTFQSRPFPNQGRCRLGCDQIMTFQLLPAAARAEPHKPPISAWLELEGNPDHQVMRFQKIAPNNAQTMMSEVRFTILASIRPDEIVLATAVPHIAPSKLVEAARIIA